MKYYCHLDTNGTVDRTNLQLYSLQMAAESWNELCRNRAWYEKEGGFKERVAFIVTCFGLSLSQLLGQNNPFPQSERVKSPRYLVEDVLKQAGVDTGKRAYLVDTFRDFLTYYDAARHFGRMKNDGKHRIVNRLTFTKLNKFRQMTIEIWDLLIAAHRKNPENKLTEVASIASVVGFEDAIDAE